MFVYYGDACAAVVVVCRYYGISILLIRHIIEPNRTQIGYGGFYKKEWSKSSSKQANKANKCHFSTYACKSVHEVLMMLITAKKGREIIIIFDSFIHQ